MTEVLWDSRKTKKRKYSSYRYAYQVKVFWLFWTTEVLYDKRQDAEEYAESMKNITTFPSRVVDRFPEFMSESVRPTVAPKAGSGGSHAGKPPRGGSGISRPVPGVLADGLRKGLGDA